MTQNAGLCNKVPASLHWELRKSQLLTATLSDNGPKIEVDHFLSSKILSDTPNLSFWGTNLRKTLIDYGTALISAVYKIPDNLVNFGLRYEGHQRKRLFKYLQPPARQNISTAQQGWIRRLNLETEVIAQLALWRPLIKEQKRQAAAVANLIDHVAALANEAAQHCNYPDWDSSVYSIVFA